MKLWKYKGRRLAAILLCLCLCLTGNLSHVQAEENSGAAGKQLLSEVSEITAITLSYENGNEVGEEGELIQAGTKLELRYDFKIGEAPTPTAGEKYYLMLSPHLQLPVLTEAIELKITEGEESSAGQTFARLYSDGTEAWLEFEAEASGSGLVIDAYDEVTAYFYLECVRAGNPPLDASDEEKNNNQYLMKFENGKEIRFGYWELVPLRDKAKLEKTAGELTGKTIEWTISYTPWQNPREEGLQQDTPFEIRDVLDPAKHTFKGNTVTVATEVVTLSAARPDDTQEIYAFLEAIDGKPTLVIGGTKLGAGTGKNGNTRFSDAA